MSEFPTSRDNVVSVSVIMPVYNGAQFIDTTIRCLLQQSMTDFELLICDDSSTDSSYERLQYWQEKDSRITLFRNEVNRGVFETQKFLAAQIHGEFIAQQDQDDYSSPDRLEEQVRLLRQNPAASGTVSNIWIVDEFGDPIGISRIPQTVEGLSEAMKLNNVVCHSSLMMRATAFAQTGGYRKEADHVADYDLLLRLLKIGPLIPSPKALTTYGYSPGTVTFRDRKTQMALAKEIRHRHFESHKPQQTKHTPLTREQARVPYYKEIGKLYLIKGNINKARYNYTKLLECEPSIANRCRLLITHIPEKWIHWVLQRVRKTSPREEAELISHYFLKTYGNSTKYPNDNL